MTCRSKIVRVGDRFVYTSYGDVWVIIRQDSFNLWEMRNERTGRVGYYAPLFAPFKRAS